MLDPCGCKGVYQLQDERFSIDCRGVNELGYYKKEERLYERYMKKFKINNHIFYLGIDLLSFVMLLGCVGAVVYAVTH